MDGEENRREAVVEGFSDCLSVRPCGSTTSHRCRNREDFTPGLAAAARQDKGLKIRREVLRTMSLPKFKRILLKLSGEVLMGNQQYGIDPEFVAKLAGEVRAAKETGLQICLVLGGGNIFRGVAGAAKGMDRAQADYMGMLATVMNALAMQNALEQIGVETRVQSAIQMDEVCEPVIRRRAERHLEKGRVVIFAAGVGSPYFTTDSGAALRAAEMKCDALLKGTSVDGVYDADPKVDVTAKRYETVDYDTVLANNLKVMDASAVALCRDNSIPIIVFSIREQGNLAKVLAGEGTRTIVQQKD